MAAILVFKFEGHGLTRPNKIEITVPFGAYLAFIGLVLSLNFSNTLTTQSQTCLAFQTFPPSANFYLLSLENAIARSPYLKQQEDSV